MESVCIPTSALASLAHLRDPAGAACSLASSCFPAVLMCVSLSHKWEAPTCPYRVGETVSASIWHPIPVSSDTCRHPPTQAHIRRHAQRALRHSQTHPDGHTRMAAPFPAPWESPGPILPPLRAQGHIFINRIQCALGLIHYVPCKRQFPKELS
jgi:hypothetical protein